MKSSQGKQCQCLSVGARPATSAKPVGEGKPESNDFLDCECRHALRPISGVVGVVLIAVGLAQINACGYPKMEALRAFSAMAFLKNHRQPVQFEQGNLCLRRDGANRVGIVAMRVGQLSGLVK